MPDEQMVCKHCGGRSFYANVAVSAWIDSTGVWVGDDGQPHFEPNGRPELDDYDYDIEQYVCNDCRREAFRLDDLVVRAPQAGDLPIAPCGRCDHSRAEHPEGMHRHRDSPYTRGAMPCQHEGCDCHDYYDREFAEAGQPAETLAAVKAA